jgi:hypothetical protein
VGADFRAFFNDANPDLAAFFGPQLLEPDAGDVSSLWCGGF